jgi:hypothetical protein
MGSWFDRSRGQAGLLAKATALLIEPLQLGALDADPLRALAGRRKTLKPVPILFSLTGIFKVLGDIRSVSTP